MKLRVELYGRLKDAGLGNVVELDVDRALRAEEILAVLAERFGTKRKLLSGSVLANESEVLGSGSIISSEERLAVLPPGCGG